MKVILIRYSEIHLKGNNRRFFENALVTNIRRSLSDIECSIAFSSSRYIVSGFDADMTAEIISRLQCIFGIYSMSVASVVDSTYEQIVTEAKAQCPSGGTFKVVCNRADKKFPLNSMQLAMEVGGDLLESNDQLSVDLHNPQHKIHIDVRENGKTYVFRDIIKGSNGMPVGTGGKGMVLLSGGIDSPVACYMMAKRGMSLRAVHFHSFPYTSIQARDKVLELARIVTKYTQSMTVDVVSFTEIQTSIHDNCPEELLITIMRRFMMRIAEQLAIKHGCHATVTGESLGQVASQTIQSIASTNSVAKLPVLRPLIAFDKDEIIEISKRVNTFETSILPHEDCCTIFLPKSPATKPKISVVERWERKLDIDTLVANAVASVETFEI